MIIIRLWHKDLIPYLPKNQLLGQWRECCCIAKNIADNGTPNHILVNKIMDYPIEHFAMYSYLIYDEMKTRKYKCNYNKFSKWIDINTGMPFVNNLFKDWHNNRYLTQCYYNLQEKYDCGGISKEEWNKIEIKFKEYI